MGFRFNLGGRPGTKLAGVLAVAAAVAITAQGAIGAPSDKKPKDARHGGQSQSTGAAQQKPSTGTDQKAVRTVGGVTVKIDPSTGRMVPPTAEEAAMLATALSHYLSREADGLTPFQLPDGTYAVDLQDSFQEAVMASVNPRGGATLRCVDNYAQAARILAGQPINDGATEMSRVDAKRAAVKSRPAPAEKE